MATPTTERLRASVFAGFGDTDDAVETLLNYTEASTTVGNRKSKISRELATSASTTVDLSGEADTINFIMVQDKNNTGIQVGVGGSTDKLHVAANGFLIFKNAASPMTLYLTNPSSSDKAFVEISILGTST